MMNTFKVSYMVSFTEDTNTLIYWLKKLPLVGNKIKPDLYSAVNAKRVLGIIGFIIHILYRFISKLLYVLIFNFIPALLFANMMDNGEAGYPREACMIFIALVMNGFCGSLINSSIFTVDKGSFILLKYMKADPSETIRSNLIIKLIFDFISLWFAFTVFGVGAGRAFFLMVTITMCRFIGEAVNLIFFNYMKRSISSVSLLSISIMLFSLFIAYFIPYLRGHMFDAYGIFFDGLGYAATLIIGAVFFFLVWRYKDYQRIAVRIYSYSAFSKVTTTIKEASINDVKINEKQISKSELRSHRYEKLEGYEYLNRLFFTRNKRLVRNAIATRLGFIAVALAVAVFACVFGEPSVKRSIWDAITGIMPILVFAMYVMSTGNRICKAVFYNCDRSLLKYGYYRDKDAILENFTIRMKWLLTIDLIPASAICVALGILGIVCDQDKTVATLFPICLGVLLLSCFFTILSLFTYYILQPYNSSMEVKNVTFTIVNTIIYVLCYLCLQIETDSIFFALGISMVVAIFLSLATTIIYRYADKTFKLR